MDSWPISSLSPSIITTHSLAPSAPRDVSARLITPFLVEVSWRAPAIPNGVITHYTVYAVPQISHEETRNKRNTATTPRTIKKVIPMRSLISLNLPISTILKHFLFRHFQAQVLLAISVLQYTPLPTSFKLVLQSILAKLPMREIALLSHQTQLYLYQGQVYRLV